MLTFSKNAYMCFGGYHVEDSGYCWYPFRLQNCWDTTFTDDCELCYECSACTKSYNCDFCTECVNCSDSRFCFDCRGCKNCFGCVGLRQKEYYIFNKPYTREKYLEEMKKWNLHDVTIRAQAEEEVAKLRQQHPHVFSVQVNTQNCFGDNIVNSKNCYSAFHTLNAEDCAYTFHVDKMKDCYDTEVVASSELTYECTPGYDLYNCNFCLECGNTKNAEYSVRCFNSHDVFGCVGRNHAEFEILNQKYNKEDYFKKVAEIKEKLRAEKTYVNWLADIVGKID